MNPILEALIRSYPGIVSRIGRDRLESMSADELRAEIRAGDATAPVQFRTGIEPKSVDVDKRSIDVVIATDARVRMLDLERWEIVDEVLPMEGCRLEDVEGLKIPIIDSHDRSTVDNVFGSCVELKTGEHELSGRELWSSAEEKTFTKAAEGHLDKRSVGYTVRAAIFVEPGEKAEAFGRTFEASEARALKIATDWIPREESVVAIPADPRAGARSSSGTGTGAANQTGQQSKKGEDMNPKFLAYLKSRGLKADATDDDARAFGALIGCTLEDWKTAGEPEKDPSGRAAPPAPPISGTPGAGAPDGVSSARTRAATNAEVFATFKPWDSHDTMRAERDAILAEDPVPSVEVVRERALRKLSELNKPVGGGHVRTGVEERDHRRAGITAALSIRQFGKPVGDKPEEQIERARAFRGMTLFEIARHCLEVAGERTVGLDRMEIVGRAFTHSTSDFPYALEDSARKSLLAAYAMSPATWPTYCKRMSLSDFKAARIIKLGEFSALEAVPEGGEFPYTSMSEDRETVQLATYGDIFSVTRQMIVNDDLGAFTDVPTRFGRAWARTINRLAVTKLLANPTLTDGTALFAAGHANYLTGAGYIPDSVADVQSVVAALTLKLRKQTALSESGETVYLNVPPRVFLAGPTYEQTIRQGLYESGMSDNNSPSWLRQMGLVLAIEPEIENTNITGNSTTGVYLLGDPSEFPVVVMAFLDGNDAPYLESERGFDVDGTRFKVRGDCGAGIADYRGAAWSVGA